MSSLLILGNQLFDPKILRQSLRQSVHPNLPAKTSPLKVFMKEDFELCTYFKFHKQKLVFFLAAMRTYADELREEKFEVHYETLSNAKYEDSLSQWVKNEKIKELSVFEIEDKFFERRVFGLAERLKIKIIVLPSPMFLTTRKEFEDYSRKNKRPFMKTFYEQQRKRLSVLVLKDGSPVGGSWSFDEDNRQALPSSVQPPAVAPASLVKSNHVVDVETLVARKFAKHPGDAQEFWLPVDRPGAEAWLERFLKERLSNFGPYEDAISPRSDFVFHSVLTPFLNTGLLTPKEVIDRTLKFADRRKVPLNSVEGFVRQVIGWREFVRGIYQQHSEKQDVSNFWDHRRKLSSHWYNGETGVPPLDCAIQKTIRYGYCHHIERLMVIGSLMLLLEVDPKEAHRWFMEMFIDSSDWVMGPNVYGMALFSDGGIFATKPYICGSNYYRKMGGYKAGEWCDGVDGLYWSFIEKHKSFFLKNPRLSMMARSVEKMDIEKKQRIYKAADLLRDRLTSA